jgi:hypothetical protein
LTEQKIVTNWVGPTPSRRRTAFAEYLFLAAISVIAGVVGTAGPARGAPALQLVYRITHSVIGDVGSYTCTVEPLGNGATQVEAREQIDVRMLGIPIYHLNATDIEHWAGDRLIAFDAVTEKADGRAEIRGAARGDQFIVTSPQGRLTTTATVHPAEPCAPNFLQSTTVLHPDTGGLDQVRLSGGEPSSLNIAGTSIPVRKYILDGKTRYTVWVDSRDLPVKFVVDDSSGQATFTLAKCVSCTPQISRLGME